MESEGDSNAYVYASAAAVVGAVEEEWSAAEHADCAEGEVWWCGAGLAGVWGWSRVRV